MTEELKSTVGKARFRMNEYVGEYCTVQYLVKGNRDRCTETITSVTSIPKNPMQ